MENDLEFKTQMRTVGYVALAVSPLYLALGLLVHEHRYTHFALAALACTYYFVIRNRRRVAVTTESLIIDGVFLLCWQEFESIRAVNSIWLTLQLTGGRVKRVFILDWTKTQRTAFIDFTRHINQKNEDPA